MGSIYRGHGLGREQVGEYDDSPAGAAAFLLFNAVGDTTTSKNGDSDSSFLEVIFSLLVYLVARIIWPVISFLFVYWTIPMTSSLTWLIWPMGFSGMVSPLLMIPIAILMVICHISFYPYWIKLIIFKVHKQITTKIMLKMYWKYFLKGPFAYKDMKVLQDSMIQG
ncbi:MAG: hypothetical protein HFE77_01505 [Clostridiales bacterium]|nr:hypothetical protein [Clostridiales bacterium]